MGVGRIFLGGNSGFFQVVTKTIFAGKASMVKFYFTDSKLTLKHFSTTK